MDTEGKFYLGRIFDDKKKQLSEETLLYDPEDLTTHAVVVGMTGSGKTGLCVGLLEEAALNEIPALMIDPKGDITNLLLHFPELRPLDFQPWVNPDEARRSGQTIEQTAEGLASRWKSGLAEWQIEPARIQALADAAHFAIYTPGSTAGIPISILASFKAPSINWNENSEMLREKISGTVTALLTLVGMGDIDPVRSREHILLSNIFETAWSSGKDLDLGELIMQVQSPPFTRLGVMDINRFFPEKDRFELAMLLNNILASPAFQSWLEGQPLDIAELLYGRDGRPRHSVFYLAHLSDDERMFFITLLYSAVESWMRTQPGTTSLRAIVYFDEIFGYLPPTKNPPSKQLLLRLLKQARAFGVGQLLVTQNPVDLDYKALSNTGTWMIGKLQTDQDKQRLLDGLEGAAAGSLDRGDYDRLLSDIGKRVFLLHNVHAKKPHLFQTRWAMNYLAGPLTRSQIPDLNALVGAKLETEVAQVVSDAPDESVGKTTSSTNPAATAHTVSAGAAMQDSDFSTTRPSLPVGMSEFFLPNKLSFTEAFEAAGKAYPDEAHNQDLVYCPVLAGQATTRFLNRKYSLDYDLKTVVIIEQPDRRGVVRWEEFLRDQDLDQQLGNKPDPRARYAPIDAPLSDQKLMKSMESDFLDWIYSSRDVIVKANEDLTVYAGPDLTQAEFTKLCTNEAEKSMKSEGKKIEESFDNKIDALQKKITQEERELERDKDEYSRRKMEEMGAGFDTIMGMLGGRRRSISKNLTKRRMTGSSKSEVDESVDAIADYQKQITNLEAEKAQALKELEEQWGEIASHIDEIRVTPYKKDILVDFFGVAWFPYYLVQTPQGVIELPGYE